MSGEWARATELEKALKKEVRGEVRFDAGSRALYATDASNYRQVPIGVVVPDGAPDVEAALAVCRRFEAPVLARGGGTSLAGQCCNAAVVFDFSKKLNRVLDVDGAGQWARVEPGVVLDSLQDEAKRQGLIFGPDPATHDHCTLGGMIGNNSCGVHSMIGGRTVDNVLELEIVTYDGLRATVGPTPPEALERLAAGGGREGELYGGLRALIRDCGDSVRARFPNIPRRVSGYQLDQLLPENDFHVARSLVGSESTCVLLLSAKLRLLPNPRARSLLVLGYADVFSAGDHVPDVLPFSPIGLEGLDQGLVQDAVAKGLHREDMRLLPEGGGWLVVEFGGSDKAESDAKARECMRRLAAARTPPSMRLYDDPGMEKKIWEIRESGLGATAFVPGQAPTWEGWEDAAVPPDRLGSYLRRFKDLLRRFNYKGDLYGHFGQGCVHTRISFDLLTAEGIARYQAFIEEAASLVVEHGGSLSGEHGDGQSRARLLPKMFGEEVVAAFRRFKRLWDPDNRMNPGKKIDAFGPTDNLRLGPRYAPADPPTRFSYPDDGHSFAHAALRCVGVGKCRRLDGGVMCPSFMHTREETHSTRGRAHLLFEMLRGETIRDGWRSDAVREALDLCLSCKGCKGECPVNVDMAADKAEFLSHYYGWTRLRPRAAYAMGQIRFWSSLAMLWPAAANAAAAGPAAAVLRRLGGIDPRRSLPRFAGRSFRAWFDARPPSRISGPEVLLWPDTFTDRFHPRAAQATVEALEGAGWRVRLPPEGLCCGRPLYDYGFLGQAKRLLAQIVEALREDARAGAPVIVLEPSCAAVFRDELLAFFPNDHDAHRLSRQTFLLSEFLEKNGLHPKRRFAGPVLLHGHCHQKSLMGMEHERRALEAMGFEVETPEPGCCGMAGSFGFEAGEHCDLSLKIGRRLIQAVAAAPADVPIVADGFSCREQIRQGTGRNAVHLAELLAQDLHFSRVGLAPKGW